MDNPRPFPSSDARPDGAITFVVVTYNSRHVVGECLRALSVLLSQSVHGAIVIDNASSDGTPEEVLRRCPEAALISNDCNRGFAAAVNQGLCKVLTPFAIILNPDTFLDSFTALRLVQRMLDAPDIGLATCRLIDSSGKEQKSYSFYYPGDRRGVAPAGEAGDETTLDVAWVVGALMAVRMEAVRAVGLLDEDYFMYFEDTDWCRRMRSRGWRVTVFRDLSATHLGSGSSEGVSSLEGAKRYFCSELLFHEKHYPRGKVLLHLANRAASTIAQVGFHALLRAVNEGAEPSGKWFKHRARAEVLLERAFGRRDRAAAARRTGG